MAIDPKKLAAFGKKKNGGGGDKGKKFGAFAKGKGKGHGDDNDKEHDEKPDDEEDEHGHGGGGGHDEDDHDHDQGHGGDDHDEGDHGADDEDEEEHDIDVDAIADQVESGRGDKKLMKLSRNIHDDTLPTWASDEELWEAAVEKVDPEGEGSHYDLPWSIVAHVYQKMGGKIH